MSTQADDAPTAEGGPPDQTWTAPIVSGPLLWTFVALLLGVLFVALGIANPTWPIVAAGIVILLEAIVQGALLLFWSARWVSHWPDGRIRFESKTRVLEAGAGEILWVKRIPVLFDRMTVLPAMVKTTNGSMLLYPRMSSVTTLLSTILEENPASSVVRIWPGRL
jgi:hypothetical protein